MGSEKRLIDANGIIAVAERAYDAWNLAMAAADGKREINLVYKRQELCKAVKAVADNCPTVDAVEVVHGRWDSSGKYRFHGDNSVAVRCTVCGCCLTEPEYRRYTWNYCPVCGAKMDGDGNG